MRTVVELDAGDDVGVLRAQQNEVNMDTGGFFAVRFPFCAVAFDEVGKARLGGDEVFFAQ